VSPEADRHLASLMEKSQAGDEVAYKALLTEVATLARKYISRRLTATDAIDDVVQEILVSVHKAKPTYDPTRPFGPWLYAIAHFRLTDHVRQLYRNKSREVVCETTENLGQDDIDLDLLFKNDVDQLLGTLPPKQRDVIRLLKIEELSVKEVAQKMGLSESDIKVSAHRGLKSLRQQLEGENRGDV